MFSMMYSLYCQLIRIKLPISMLVVINAHDGTATDNTEEDVDNY